MTWDERFLDLAAFVAQWSKDPRSKVGAVVADPTTNRVLGIGYNGFPRGVVDSLERLNDRAIKHKLIVHAETNALLNAARTKETTLYITVPPCGECAKVIVQAGVTRVVCAAVAETHWAHWKESMETSVLILREGGVHLDIKELK